MKDNKNDKKSIIEPKKAEKEKLVYYNTSSGIGYTPRKPDYDDARSDEYIKYMLDNGPAGWSSSNT